QSQLPVALAPDFHAQLEDVLPRPAPGAEAVLGGAQGPLQDVEAARVHFQGAEGEVVVGEGVAGALDELLADVLDVAPGGPGPLGQLGRAYKELLGGYGLRGPGVELHAAGGLLRGGRPAPAAEQRQPQRERRPGRWSRQVHPSPPYQSYRPVRSAVFTKAAWS